ncbi:MAG: single-stranded DNA-binding protein, partial [Clostridia bacterium]
MTAANNVTAAGCLTRDLELRYTPSGRANASICVAVSSDWTDSAGERHESVGFFDVIAWGRLAESAAQSLATGGEVLVAGRLAFGSWETDDAERRSKVEIAAGHVGVGMTFATAVFTKTALTQVIPPPSRQGRGAGSSPRLHWRAPAGTVHPSLEERLPWRRVLAGSAK